MSLWPLCSKKNPCPICGKDHWSCRFGTFKILCMREPSDHPSHDGGWYHPYEGGTGKIPFRIEKRDVAPPLENAEELINQWASYTGVCVLANEVKRLGVTFESVEWMRMVWSPVHSAWAFPMRDGEGKIIGIRLRNEAGEKWAVKGSRNGLFIPCYYEGDQKQHDLCLVCEGPTSTAAALSMGFYAIGRPSCNTGADQLKVALKLHQIRRVVIVADNDDKRRPDGRQWSPGIDGARALASALRMPHVIWIPPTKDIRDFLKSGGTKQVIESAIKSQVWKRA